MDGPIKPLTSVGFDFDYGKLDKKRRRKWLFFMSQVSVTMLLYMTYIHTSMCNEVANTNYKQTRNGA